MSDPTSPPAPAPAPAPVWPPLEPYERRVLGVLIEKQKTSKSADAYPMSLNAITTGCNQKSNRDPVYELDEDDVDETLAALQKKGLAARITGGRVERFKHQLYDVWRVTKVEMAVLAELLLRGPQTEGDLRGRAARMDDIKDVEELRGLVKGLVERNFVVYVSEPGRRGTVVTHGFHTPAELEKAKAQFGGGAGDAEPAPGSSRSGGGGSDGRLADALAEIARLKETVARLEREVAGLRQKLGG